MTATKKNGEDPRLVISTAAFHARVRGSFPRRFERNRNVSSPSTPKNSVLWGASVTDW